MIWRLKIAIPTLMGMASLITLVVILSLNSNTNPTQSKQGTMTVWMSHDIIAIPKRTTIPFLLFSVMR
jgi:hypothetical protein